MMKDKILTTATNMFLDIGFKSVTMDDISNKLGISKKTVYTHFKNKTALITESTHFIFEHISSGIENIKNQKLNAIKELFEIKKFIQKTLNNEKTSPQYQLQKYFPEIYQDLRRKQLTVVNECVTDNVKKGIDHGFFRKEINISFTTLIYFSGINSIGDEDIFPQDLFKKQELLNTYLDYHIRAIATPKGIKILEETLKQDQ